MPLLLLFVDGLGLGNVNGESNPLATAKLRFWQERFQGQFLTAPTVGAGLTAPHFICRPTETTMGIAGLPQSATGQTAIFTGVNAARAVGRHVNGFPTPTLRRIIEEHSLFKRLKQAGRQAVFANVFTNEYFETARKGKWRHSVTTTAVLAADCDLLRVTDLRAGTAVYQDIINEQLQAKGYDLPLLSPEAAAANLIRRALRHDFTLFEYFQTDHCGHQQDWELARILLNRLDRFIGTITAQVDEAGLDLLLVSDHGNIEDLSVKTHTFNPAPTIAVGPRAAEFGAVGTLLDIYPAVLRYFKIGC